MFKIIGFVLLIYACMNMEDKKLTTKAVVSFFIGFALCIIPTNIVDMEQLSAIFKIPQVWIGIVVLVYFIVLKLSIKLRNKYYEIDAKDDIDILKRTIDFEYNPSIAGFLFKHKLELKDLSADILNLYAKKIIKIKKNENGKNKLYLGEKYEEYKENLKASDKYIIDYINDDNNSKFNFSEWRDEVKKEYNRLKFSEDRKIGNPKVLCTIIGLIVVLGFFVLKDLYKIIGILFLFLLMYYIRYINIRNRYIVLTYRGKNALKDCIKLKKFIKGYTLLKDRTVEEISIYENYIPYAIALGINKKYEGTIFEIFGEELANIAEDIDVIEFYDEKYIEKF